MTGMILLWISEQVATGFVSGSSAKAPDRKCRQVEVSNSCGQNYPVVLNYIHFLMINSTDISGFNDQFNYPFISHSPHVQFI